MTIIRTPIALFTLLLAVLISSPAIAAQRVSQYTKDKLSKELPVFDLTIGDAVFIRTFKRSAQLELWMRPSNATTYRLFRTYPICYYSGGLGPKLVQGDKVTPEGFYAITQSSLNPRSHFHLSMNIGYPNAFDRFHGRTGSLIMIHGACDAVGCFAMSNPQIEEIYYLVEQALRQGQTSIAVHALPFRLEDNALAQYRDAQWYDFWQQLKTGYDLFNTQKIPPTISMKDGRYRIQPANAQRPQ